MERGSILGIRLSYWVIVLLGYIVQGLFAVYTELEYVMLFQFVLAMICFSIIIPSAIASNISLIHFWCVPIIILLLTAWVLTLLYEWFKYKSNIGGIFKSIWYIG